MDYKKIIEEYQAIQALCGDCKSSQKENSKKLIRDIKESLKDKSFQEYSQLFSELFDIWLVSTETTPDINIFPFDDQVLDKKYKEYREQTSIFPISLKDDLPIAASKKLPTYELKEKSIEDRQKRVDKLLDFSSISQPDILPKSRAIIEYTLSELWSHIFQNRLAFLNLEDDKREKEHLKIDKYFHQNWPLYELMNQISKTVDTIIQEGKDQRIKIASFDLFQKEEVIANTEEMCQHILETHVLGKQPSSKWIPQLSTYKEIQVSHIIATSDLVSYMFKYKLMSKKKQTNYLEEVNKSVENIYNNLICRNVLYDAICSYINENDKEEIVINYKNHLLSPRIILMFIISIIQEVVRKALTQSRNNIFHNINGQSRDKGLSEKFIITEIKKDAKAYMHIYHYFDKPVSATIKKKEKQLNEWIQELNKLRYGVLDDYLFDLAEAAQISFEETTVTSIKTSRKMK